MSAEEYKETYIKAWLEGFNAGYEKTVVYHCESCMCRVAPGFVNLTDGVK